MSDDATANGTRRDASVIAVGDGAAALNILSSEKGERYHDFDVPADASRVFGEPIAE